MICPFCGSSSDKVLESRSGKNKAELRRRRECLSCGRRFTTKETVVNISPMIVKRNGQREIFSQDKLIRGIQIACNKRPVSSETIAGIAKELEQRCIQCGDSEVTSGTLGKWVSEELKKTDMVAYIRFMSVYMHFESIEQFSKLINSGEDDEA
ncbi:MAG: transcriptional repressor NrdR [Abditibacteriota bacterium]|nr:transcriptional repressor NrdR [Abditibacteriota bacterium]